MALKKLIGRKKANLTDAEVDAIVREVELEVARKLYQPTEREACVAALRRILQLSTSVKPNSRRDRAAIHQLAKDTLMRLGCLDSSAWDVPETQKPPR